MAGKAVEVKIEAMYRQEIRLAQKKLRDLKRLKNEVDESSETDMAYIRRQELAVYINQCQIALKHLKQNSKHYPQVRGIRLLG